ncbi:MAG: MBOAT family protein [Lachnospiraceae bacterium]|nr:MBOAT family protein [Lachnospiraceae bacterium]
MVFNSIGFLIFFPIVLAVYYIIPKKIKPVWLLAASFFFYASWNLKYTSLLIVSILLTYFGGLIISRTEDRKLKKATLITTVVLNLGILAVFKYLDLIFHSIGTIVSMFGGQEPVNPLNLLLPVGISFYTFQAIGYTVDVYRGTAEAERNPIRYALFVSFFPQLVAGPIERTGNLLSQIRRMEKEKITSVDNLVRGAYTMLYGFILKVIIADRAAVYVNLAYSDSWIYFTGLEIFFAAVLFSLQIYCDFAGYTYIAIGAARTMGIEIRDNFRAPYLSRSIREFWDRWHISLTSWFRDYLYFPLGGSRKGKVRKYVNILIVFLISGLWHGAAYHFVFWGLLHGIFRVLGELTEGLRAKIAEKLKYDRNTAAHKAFQVVLTFFNVTVFWMFFRADSVNQAFVMLGRMFTGFGLWQFTDGSLLNKGVDGLEMYVLVVFVALMVIVDVCIRKKKDVIGFLMKQNIWFNFLLFLAGILAVVIYGAYGGNYNASDFIYFQF